MGATRSLGPGVGCRWTVHSGVAATGRPRCAGQTADGAQRAPAASLWITLFGRVGGPSKAAALQTALCSCGSDAVVMHGRLCHIVRPCRPQVQGGSVQRGDRRRDIRGGAGPVCAAEGAVGRGALFAGGGAAPAEVASQSQKKQQALMVAVKLKDGGTGAAPCALWPAERRRASTGASRTCRPPSRHAEVHRWDQGSRIDVLQ